jgi:hypothetical protein
MLNFMKKILFILIIASLPLTGIGVNHRDVSEAQNFPGGKIRANRTNFLQR